MSEFTFRRAAREAAPLTIAISGPSGSGKTYSALLMARGLVGPEGRIAVIDTEGKRALVYADDPDIGGFDHLDLQAPYSSERHIEAIRAAIAHGAQAIVVDSASHEHEAEGGYLYAADAEERRLSNRKDVSRAKWIKPAMAHSRYMTFCRSVPVHIIFCIREKTIVDMDSKPPVKMHVPACHRDFLYDMALSWRIEPETHNAQAVRVIEPFRHVVPSGTRLDVETGRRLAGEAARGTTIEADLMQAEADLREAASRGLLPLRAESARIAEANKGLLARLWQRKPALKEQLAEMAKEADRIYEEAAEAPEEDSGLFTPAKAGNDAQ